MHARCHIYTCYNHVQRLLSKRTQYRTLPENEEIPQR